MIKRVLGSAILAGVLAVGMVAQSAPSATAVNAGAGGGLFTGGFDYNSMPVEMHATIGGSFTAVQTAPVVRVATCDDVVVSLPNPTVLFSVQDPQSGGSLYSMAHFGSGGFFGGSGLACSVIGGTIGDGALYAATNPAFSGPDCASLSLIPNAPGDNPCQGVSYISVGSVFLAEFGVSYTVNSLTGSVNSGPQEMIAVAGPSFQFIGVAAIV